MTQGANYTFSAKVIQLIQAIPKGKVASYGQIAAMAGKSRGSRAVAWLLHSSTKAHKLPWHRVLNSKGHISFPKGTKHFREQKMHLQREGIEVSASGAVDLKICQWRPKPKRQGPRMFADDED